MVHRVLDLHVDSVQRALDLGHDLGTGTPGHLDLPKARRGGLGAVVLASWADGSYASVPGASRARVDALLDAAHALLAAHPARLALATDGASLDAAVASGALAVLLGIEGGHALEDDVAALDHFHARGVRVLTLTWNNHLPWARSCQDGAGPDVPEGLSDRGRAIVRRMGELGMLVDLSHAGRRTFLDALEEAAAPVAASHSACAALHDHPRNLDDERLRALAANGGVVGIPWVTPFLDADARAEEQRVRSSDEYASVDAATETERMLLRGELLQRVLPPFPLDRVVDHVLHACEVAGVEHVAIGSDLDGTERRPEGLVDASGYPALLARLAERGLGAEGVEAVAWGNAARVLAAATAPGAVDKRG